MPEEKVVAPEVTKEINDLVAKGVKALEEFESLNQEQIDYIVAKCCVAGLDHHGTLAKAAIDETHRGVFEDKATKNLFACEYVQNNMRSLKTVGVVSNDPVTGITEIAEPIPNSNRNPMEQNRNFFTFPKASSHKVPNK